MTSRKNSTIDPSMIPPPDPRWQTAAATPTVAADTFLGCRLNDEFPPIPTRPAKEVDWTAAGYRYLPTRSPVERCEPPPVLTVPTRPVQEVDWTAASNRYLPTRSPVERCEPPPVLTVPTRRVPEVDWTAVVDLGKPIGPGSYRRSSGVTPVYSSTSSSSSQSSSSAPGTVTHPEDWRNAALEHYRRRAPLHMRYWHWYN